MILRFSHLFYDFSSLLGLLEHWLFEHKKHYQEKMRVTNYMIIRIINIICSRIYLYTHSFFSASHLYFSTVHQSHPASHPPSVSLYSCQARIIPQKTFSSLSLYKNKAYKPSLSFLYASYTFSTS